MSSVLPLWPESASVTVKAVDPIYIAELVLTALVLCFVFGLMITFCIRFRKGSKARRARPEKSWRWEIGWTAAALVVFMGMFAWGASAYIYLYQPPHADLEIYVVAKQWMWKTQHPGGQREIDALHVPIGKTVRLVLASQDVIHSFYVPAFRIKHDVVPGTYEVLWFKATKLGQYPLECAEYCGTAHSSMTGTVYVMTPAGYRAWLEEQGVHESLAEQGESLFRSYGCSGCHTEGSTVHAPSLVGVYGHLVHLEDGSTLIADERYIRDSIVEPRSQIVAGYGPLMPSFRGEIGEGDLFKLVAYVKSLAGKEESQP